MPKLRYVNPEAARADVRIAVLGDQALRFDAEYEVPAALVAEFLSNGEWATPRATRPRRRGSEPTTIDEESET